MNLVQLFASLARPEVYGSRSSNACRGGIGYDPSSRLPSQCLLGLRSSPPSTWDCIPDEALTKHLHPSRLLPRQPSVPSIGADLMSHCISSDDIVEDSEPEREQSRRVTSVYDRSGSSPFVIDRNNNDNDDVDDHRDGRENEDHSIYPIVIPPETSVPATIHIPHTSDPTLPIVLSSPTPTPPSAQLSSRFELVPSPIKSIPFPPKSSVPECPFNKEMRSLKECVICAQDWSEPGKKVKAKWMHLLGCDPSISHSLLLDMVRAQLDSLKSLKKTNSVAKKRRSLSTQANGTDSVTSESTTVIDLTETINSHYFQPKLNPDDNSKASTPLANRNKTPPKEIERLQTDVLTTPRQRSPGTSNDQLRPLYSPCRTPPDNDESALGKPAEKMSAFAKFAYARSVDGSEPVVTLVDAPAQQKRKVALIPKRAASKPSITVPDCPIEGSEMKKLTKCLICSEDWSKDRKIWKTKWKHIFVCSMRSSRDTTAESLKEMILAHIRRGTISAPKSLLQSLTTKQKSGGRKVIKETTLVPVATEEGRERMKIRIEKVLASSDSEMDREEDKVENGMSMLAKDQQEEREDKGEAIENESSEAEEAPASTQTFTTSNLGSRFFKYGVSDTSTSGLSSKRGRGWFDEANRGSFVLDGGASFDQAGFLSSDNDEREDTSGEDVKGESSPTREPSFSLPDSSSSSNVNPPLPTQVHPPSLLAPPSSHCQIQRPSTMPVLASPRKAEVTSWVVAGLNTALRLRGGGGEQGHPGGETSLIVVDDGEEDGNELVELDSSPEIVDLVDSVEEVLSSSSPLQIVSELRPIQLAISSSSDTVLHPTSGTSRSKPAFISISDDDSDIDGIVLINNLDQTPKRLSINQIDRSYDVEDSFISDGEGVLRTDNLVSLGSPANHYGMAQTSLNKDTPPTPFGSSPRQSPSPLNTPHRTPIRVAKSKGKKKAPVMPDYESWDCKKLQNLVKSYGLRQSSSKTQLISLLVDVWNTLNPDTPSDQEASNALPSTSSSASRTLERKPRKKRVSSENQELTAPDSIKGKKLKRVTVLLDGSEKDIESGPEERHLDRPWSVDVEDVESDLDGEVEQREDDLIEIFHQMIVQNEDLWLRLLRYEPVGFEEVSHLAYKHGARMKGWEIVLRRWMDSQCITYWNLEVTGGRQRAK